jgi:hypothetical protein
VSLSPTSSSPNVIINIYNNSPLPQLGNLAPLVDGDEEEIVETLFRILSIMVEVFVRLPRTLNIADDDE